MSVIYISFSTALLIMCTFLYYCVLFEHILKRIIISYSTSVEVSLRSSIILFLTHYLIFPQTMYMAYVQNCRFTSPTSLGVIWFMRVSLTELYAFNHALAYRHAFVYIRQMAFHLRNAIIANKKVGMS